MKVINRFMRETRWLSNFEEAAVTYYGLTYPNNEAAYQAAKTLDLHEREKFTTMTGKEAKRAGMNLILRPDWDCLRLHVMYHVNYEKFTKHPHLRGLLLATDDAFLIEGNTWHDNFWGDCECMDCRRIMGQNHLGRILMLIRSELQ